MNVRLRARALTVFIGDIAIFYASLFVALLIRVEPTLSTSLIALHLTPFTLILFFWVLIFYISGLYDVPRMRNGTDFFSTLFISILVNVFIAIGFFYTFPVFGIAPKTTLLFFVVTFFIFEVLWRRGFNRYIATQKDKLGVLLLGNTTTSTEILRLINSHPHLGYVSVGHFPHAISSEQLRAFLQNTDGLVVTLSETFSHDKTIASILADAVVSGIEVHSEILFYEELVRQVPLANVTPSWFFDTQFSKQTLYDQFKRTFELIGAVLLQIILLPLELCIALLIRITSRGPVFYRQARVGKHGNVFQIYKFRSMRVDAEAAGAQWSGGANDPRVTLFGKFLRHSHLDELPQLLNIIRGEVSFVGPRPERPEIIAKLTPEIPFYHMRHMVTPGITGWAQINFKKDQTIDDVKRKLEYDFYYIKHRSFLFDIAIIVRTVKSLFINHT